MDATEAPPLTDRVALSFSRGDARSATHCNMPRPISISNALKLLGIYVDAMVLHIAEPTSLNQTVQMCVHVHVM